MQLARLLDLRSMRVRLTTALAALATALAAVAAVAATVAAVAAAIAAAPATPAAAPAAPPVPSAPTALPDSDFPTALPRAKGMHCPQAVERRPILPGPAPALRRVSPQALRRSSLQEQMRGASGVQLLLLMG